MGHVPSFTVKDKIMCHDGLTENSQTNAWNLNLNDGNMNNNTKASNKKRVRAVSALLTKTETW